MMMMMMMKPPRLCLKTRPEAASLQMHKKGSQVEQSSSFQISTCSDVLPVPWQPSVSRRASSEVHEATTFWPENTLRKLLACKYTKHRAKFFLFLLREDKSIDTDLVDIYSSLPPAGILRKHRKQPLLGQKTRRGSSSSGDRQAQR
jgi:hypothetical protein